MFPFQASAHRIGCKSLVQRFPDDCQSKQSFVSIIVSESRNVQKVKNVFMMSSMEERPKSLHLLAQRDMACAVLKSGKGQSQAHTVCMQIQEQKGRWLQGENQPGAFNSRNFCKLCKTYPYPDNFFISLVIDFHRSDHLLHISKNHV